MGDYSYHATRRHAVERVTRGVISHEYAYDANGRMTTEHAVQDGEADRLVREIQYTSFSQPALITHHASPKLATDRPLLGGVEGLCQMAFYYGSDLQRLMQVKVKVKGATTTRTLYMGAYEVREVLEGSTTLLEREERSSFGSGAQVRLYTLGSGVTSVAMEFTLKDHLGSTSAVHAENGDVKQSRGQLPLDERHSYDAWGARRDGATWAPAGPQLGHSAPPAPGDPPAAPAVASSQPRGFTGHEMLDDVGLIHMNGRLYDAALGRFCSADPLVQEAENAQNFNRYTYVLNNPLSHTDPSGFSFWKKFWRAVVAIVIAIVVVLAIVYTLGAVLAAGQFLTAAAVVTSSQVVSGAVLGAAWGGLNATIQGGTFREVLRASVMGAVSGAVGAVIGGVLHDVTNPLVHAVAHGVAGGGMSEANGGSFKDGFIGSLIGAGVTTVAGGVFGWTNLYNPNHPAHGSIGFIAARTAIAAAAGGGASVLAGGKFADGAYSAAFFHLFNAELEIVFGGQKYTGYTTDSKTLEASEGESYQMEKNGKYLGHCHAEAQYFTGAPDSGMTAGGPTLLELIKAGIRMDGLAFSSFGRADGGRINSSKQGYDHTVMVVTREITSTKPQTFWQKLFRVTPVTITQTKIEIWENYRTIDKPLGIGLSRRIVNDVQTEVGGSNNMPFRLIIKK